MRLKFRRPDDMHVHFRATTRMGAIAPYTARHFARAVVMPNVPAITTPALVQDYRDQIRLVTKRTGFEPLMTIKAHVGLQPADIVRAKEAGAVAIKVYFDGMTTGHDGLLLEHLEQMGPVWDTAQQHGMLVDWHGEHPGDEIDYLDAEGAVLPYIRRVVDDFPRLRHTIEHISSREAVEWVERAPDTVSASITVHHPLLTHNDLVGRGTYGTGSRLHPHYFCWPMAKRKEDRNALVAAILSGNPKFFLGTDSAPHAIQDKLCDGGCAGLFTAPVALACLATMLEQHDSLDMFEGFTSEFGARHYGLPLNEGFVELERVEWRVPDTYEAIFEPFLAGHTLPWQVL